MPINTPYDDPTDLPQIIPVFPLEGGLLLPRAQLPLNIFEPRYLHLIDNVLKSHRLIGMVQPALGQKRKLETPLLVNIGCIGRLTAFEESGDGRYLITLTGISRFMVMEEIAVTTPYRQCRVDYLPFASDFIPRFGEADVDRESVLAALRAYLDAHALETDWQSINDAPNEALVNALSMMAPYGSREKQALLEAKTLKERAQILVAIAEMVLARTPGEPETHLN